jgi:hypothetical protein
MQNVRYTVWETNADIEEVLNYYIGDSYDIAETLAYRLFAEFNNQKDFMITVRRNGEIEVLSTLFTTKTAALRGECQG